MKLLNIKLQNFEGPFDLLLHLIKRNEMNIYDIKIYDITSQYIEYIDAMKDIELEVTSEFIVMAATLLEIKSKMLLPKVKTDEKEEEKDPRKELVERLIEYKKYKALACKLSEKKGMDYYVYTKKAEIIEEKDDSNKDILKGLTMIDLYNIFSELVEKQKDKSNDINMIEKNIPIDKFKIEDKMKEIREILLSKGSMRFSDIEFSCTCKMEVIVTFLAILELVKDKAVKIKQLNNFDKIYIERNI